MIMLMITGTITAMVTVITITTMITVSITMTTTMTRHIVTLRRVIGPENVRHWPRHHG
jgi:hypothetical protein